MTLALLSKECYLRWEEESANIFKSWLIIDQTVTVQLPRLHRPNRVGSTRMTPIAKWGRWREEQPQLHHHLSRLRWRPLSVQWLDHPLNRLPRNVRKASSKNIGLRSRFLRKWSYSGTWKDLYSINDASLIYEFSWWFSAVSHSLFLLPQALPESASLISPWQTLAKNSSMNVLGS